MEKYSKFLIIILGLYNLSYAAPKQLVVLLHGIGKSHKSMRHLARNLHLNNFEVLNVSYPSTKHPIKHLAEQIYLIPQLKSKINNKQYQINFVTHSMGGLIAQEIIINHKISNLNKIVMLAPPILGSELADFFKKNLNFLFKALYGPAGQELDTKTRSLNIQKIYNTKINNFELGIIAGTSTVDPINWLFLAKPNDGKVPLKNTHHKLAKQRLVVPTSHFFITRNKNVIANTINFLKTGNFL